MLCCTVKTNPSYVKGVSNLWNGLWNGPMEWTDGMEYQLTIIAKTHHRYKCCLAIARFNWTVKSRASYPSRGLGCFSSAIFERCVR